MNNEPDAYAAILIWDYKPNFIDSMECIDHEQDKINWLGMTIYTGKNLSFVGQMTMCHKYVPVYEVS